MRIYTYIVRGCRRGLISCETKHSSDAIIINIRTQNIDVDITQRMKGSSVGRVQINSRHELRSTSSIIYSFAPMCSTWPLSHSLSALPLSTKHIFLPSFEHVKVSLLLPSRCCSISCLLWLVATHIHTHPLPVYQSHAAFFAFHHLPQQT